MKELSQEEVRTLANGVVQEEGKQERRYHYQTIGSEEVEKCGCPAVKMSS